MSGDLGVVVALIVVSSMLILTGWMKAPGIGIVVALVVVASTAWLNDETSIGLEAPRSWLVTVVLSLVLGTSIQLLSTTLLEPMAEAVTGTEHDHSVVDAVRGDWNAFVRWLLIVWVLVAVVEEAIYRGFLLGETARLTGGGATGALIGLAASSVVFGASHLYQGRAGALSTSFVGVLLGALYVWQDYNLWLPILTHGVVDTVGLLAIVVGWEPSLARRARR